MLGLSIFLGGGGAPHPIQNMLVQVGCLALAFWPPKRGVNLFALQGIDRLLVVLAGLTIAFPLLQVVKLPPEFWMRLPGREPVEESLKIIGQPGAWMSFSVDANRTGLAALSLIPGVIALILAARASIEDRIAVLYAIVAIGGLELFWGGLQLASGNRLFMLYQGAQHDQLQGSFAYHNAIGIFLVICLTIVVGLPWRGRDWRTDLAIRLGLGATFVVAVILTQSRSSMALMVFPALLLVWKLWSRFMSAGKQANWLSPRRGLFVVVLGVIVLAGAGWGLAGNQRVEQALSRFDDLHDARPMIWEDSWTTARAYWPVGSGMGTFMTVFNIHESLENLVPPATNRAHNDYLELSIEGGVPALLLLAAWAIFVLHRSTRAGVGLRDRSLRTVTLISVLAIAGQSLIDYPLRSEAMLALAGLLLGLLSTPLDTKDNSVEA